MEGRRPYGRAKSSWRSKALREGAGRPRRGCPAGTIFPLPHHHIRSPTSPPPSPPAPPPVGPYVGCEYIPPRAPTRGKLQNFPKIWPPGIREIGHLAEGAEPPTG